MNLVPGAESAKLALRRLKFPKETRDVQIQARAK